MEVYNSSRTAAELEYALGAVPSIGENGNWFIGDEDTGIFAKGINVTGAEVGQTVKISAVDENGVPTAWEPADSADGWKEIFDVTYASDGEVLNFDYSQYADGKDLDCRQLLLLIDGVMAADAASGGYYRVNIYDENGTGQTAWVSTRATFGAANSAYVSSVEIICWGGVTACHCVGGQHDTTTLGIRTTNAYLPAIVRNVKVLLPDNAKLAAGARIALLGRK